MKRALLLLVFSAAACVVPHLAGSGDTVSSNPAGTYGRTTLTPSLADGGGAIQVPTYCLTPRAQIEVYNPDTQPICCGFDAKVTCSGASGGHMIAPAASGVPGSWIVPINCVNGAGSIWCFSSTGTDAGAVGWVETR